MLIYAALLCALTLWMMQTRRNFVRYEKIHTTEAGFLGVSQSEYETFLANRKQPAVRFEDVLKKWDRNLSEALDHTISTSVDSKAISIERKFGHNGVVYYDHKLDRRCSIFVTKEVFNSSYDAIAASLARQFGYIKLSLSFPQEKKMQKQEIGKPWIGLSTNNPARLTKSSAMHNQAL